MEKEKTKIILAFGDSSTWGAFDEEKGGWVERLKIHFFKENKNIFVENLGVESNTIEEILKRFENELKTRIYFPEYADQYDLIVIFDIGQNDSLYNKTKDNTWTKIDVFEKNLKELIKKARKFTSKIIFLGLAEVNEKETIPWEETGESYCNENIKKYNSLIEKTCKKHKVSFIPINDLLDKEDLFDGLHPNSRGHEKIFYRTKEFLLNLL